MTETLQDKIDAMSIYDSEEYSQDLIILNDVNKAIQELREEVKRLGHGYISGDDNISMNAVLSLIGEKK